MKKYKKIIIVALCVSLLLSMLSVSAFAAEETTVDNPVMPIDDETYVYYVPAGWSFDADSLSVNTVVLICDFNHSFVSVDDFVFGYSETGETSDSIFVDVNSYSSYEDYYLTPDDDFLVFCSTDSIPFFIDYGEILDFTYFFNTFSVSSGWAVSADYYDTSLSNYFVSFYLDGVFYENYNLYLGFTVSDGDLILSENSLVLFPKGDVTAEDYIVLDSNDSFSFQLFDFEELFGVFYFLLHNGEIVELLPESESLTNDLFSVFGSVGSWISGAASSLVDMFWDGSSLTFVGILSVSALALSVIFLVLSFIERFLRFGG